MKPYLLEVNHSPSFHAESSVDYKVKSALIRDTVNLIKLPIKLKHYIKGLKKKRDFERKLTGKRTKLNEGEFRASCILRKDQYINDNLGGYEIVYSPSLT